MQCYNHPDNPAHGVCKNCSKGICKECITDLGNGIACTSACIEEVKMLNNLLHKTQESHKDAADNAVKSNYGGFLFFLGFGALTILTSIFWMKKLDPFMMGMGFLGVVYGIHFFNQAQRSKLNKDN